MKSVFINSRSQIECARFDGRDERPQISVQMRAEIKWSKQPDKKEYAAAEIYLSLILPKKEASKLVKRLKEVKTTKYHVKDVLRASALPLLPPRDSLVKEAHEKILAGKRISPLLLVRNTQTGRVIVADGYHRLCSVYSIDEDAELPCKIV